MLIILCDIVDRKTIQIYINIDMSCRICYKYAIYIYNIYIYIFLSSTFLHSSCDQCFPNLSEKLSLSHIC